MIQEMSGLIVAIDVYVDSKTLLDVVSKDGGTTEKRLQIDLFALKESQDRGELTRLSWITGKSNPADALTKESLGNGTPLWDLMKSNKVDMEALAWAAHKQKVCGV